MINPHYIRLSEKNFDEIIKWTNADLDLLKESLQDSIDEQTPYYVSFERYNNSLPKWEVHTWASLAMEFRMDRIDPEADNGFVRF